MNFSISKWFGISVFKKNWYEEFFVSGIIAKVFYSRRKIKVAEVNDERIYGN